MKDLRFQGAHLQQLSSEAFMVLLLEPERTEGVPEGTSSLLR